MRPLIGMLAVFCGIILLAICIDTPGTQYVQALVSGMLLGWGTLLIAGVAEL